jgi:hypothetical protein
MKTNNILSHILVLMALLSCNHDETQKMEKMDVAIPSDLGGINLGSFIAPPGTVGVLSEDGNRLTYFLPEGYVYAGLSQEGEVLALNSGCYECYSKCNQGCDVVNLGGQIGCSRCTDRQECTGRSCDIFYSLSDAGIINLKGGISLIHDAQVIETLRTDLPSIKVLERIEEVSNEIDRFVNQVWKDKTDKNNGKWAVVNFFGAAARMWVPADLQGARLMDEGGTSCNCAEGSGCVYEAIYRMGIKVGEMCRSNAGL